jgi:hypothetical protein
MKAFIFHSVYEELFHRMALKLRDYGVEQFSGFVWGKSQEKVLKNRGIDYSPLVVFTRDLLPKYDDGKPADLDWLLQRERDLGVSIQRMLAAERHLIAGRSQDQLMRMAEVGLREISAFYDREKPDFVFTADISCFHTYAFFVLARERKIPFWCISTGRLPKRVSVYSRGMMHWDSAEDLYARIRTRGLSDSERCDAEAYVAEFRGRPDRPTGMATRSARPTIERKDATTFAKAVTRYVGDPHDPTLRPPFEVLKQRIRRIARVAATDALRTFESPVPGEKYVLYPIHFQPEASTLVLAPMYLDQVALITDIAKSLPVGYRLYAKEHLSNRGRRPLEFYSAIRAIPGVRLLGPDADTWALIKGATAITVITGTMGWEGCLFGKPVVSFGDVFYNLLPHVYKAREVPKDGWFKLFQQAIFDHHPDNDALLSLVSAIHQASFPGWMASPASFPDVLAEDNIEKLTLALATEAGLADATKNRSLSSQAP